MAQTFTDFELIIVDDGSTDGSHELCEEFAKQDSRVRLITQPNRGALGCKKHWIAKLEWRVYKFYRYG